MKKFLLLSFASLFSFFASAQKCNRLDFSATDIGETHNSVLLELLKANTREGMNNVILNWDYDPSELKMDKKQFLQKIEESYFEMKKYGTNVNEIPDYIVSADVKPFLTQMVNETNSIQSLEEYNKKLDEILSNASLKLSCLNLDQLKAAIIISKYSANAWAPVSIGGLGYYDTYIPTEQAARRWWERAIYGDMMGAMGAVHFLGIAAVVGGAFTPGTNLVILGGIGGAAALGSAYGALGL